MRIKVVPPEEDLRPPSRRASTSYHGGQRADLDDDGLPPLDAQRRLLADQALDALDLEFKAREEMDDSNSPLVLFPRALHPLTFLLTGSGSAKRAQCVAPHGHSKWRSLPPSARPPPMTPRRTSLAERLEALDSTRYAHEDQAAYDARSALRAHPLVKAELQRWWRLAMVDLLRPPPPANQVLRALYGASAGVE